MGYDLHITRRDYWADEEGPTISLEDWLSYVTSDSDVKPDPENPGPQNWVITSHPDRCPLWWDARGEIYTKNPDPVCIAKLVQIARALSARVLGDDDEIYGTDPVDPTVFVRR